MIYQESMKNALLVMSIAQHRMGEQQASLDTLNQCVISFPEFKDAYLIRGQKNLLMKKCQKALQDFIKFDQLVNQELNDELINSAQNQTKVNFLTLQVCISKEAIGDAHKKMRRYKQASKCYNDALSEL